LIKVRNVAQVCAEDDEDDEDEDEDEINFALRKQFFINN